MLLMCEITRLQNINTKSNASFLYNTAVGQIVTSLFTNRSTCMSGNFIER